MILTIEHGKMVSGKFLHRGQALQVLAAAQAQSWHGETAIALSLDAEIALRVGDVFRMGEQAWVCRERLVEDEYGDGLFSLAAMMTRQSAPARAMRVIGPSDVVTALSGSFTHWTHVLGCDADIYLDVHGSEAVVIFEQVRELCLGLRWDGDKWASAGQAVAVAPSMAHFKGADIAKATLDHPGVNPRMKAEALSWLL